MATKKESERGDVKRGGRWLRKGKTKGTEKRREDSDGFPLAVTSKRAPTVASGGNSNVGAPSGPLPYTSQKMK